MKNLSLEKHKYETQTELCLWRWKSIFRIVGNCNFRQVYLKFWYWSILKIGFSFTRRKVNCHCKCVHFATTSVPMYSCFSENYVLLLGVGLCSVAVGRSPSIAAFPPQLHQSAFLLRPSAAARKGGSSTERELGEFHMKSYLSDKTPGSGPVLHKPTLNRLFAISPTVFVDSPAKLHCRMNWNIQFWENVANVDNQTEFVYLLQRMQYWIFLTYFRRGSLGKLLGLHWSATLYWSCHPRPNSCCCWSLTGKLKLISEAPPSLVKIFPIDFPARFPDNILMRRSQLATSDRGETLYNSVILKYCPRW